MSLCQIEELASPLLNPEHQTARCRICLDEGKTLMKLCQCSGSIAYVHEPCIIQWIEARIVCQENMLKQKIQTPTCEICKASYSANIKIAREEISNELFWENVKKLTTFNSLFTLATIFIYLIVFLLMLVWVWQSLQKLSEHNEFKQDVCLVNPQQNQHLDFYSIVKYALVWGLFPLHYLYTSIIHLRKMKKFLIDGSKQIIADVTLKPKQVLKSKCQQNHFN